VEAAPVTGGLRFELADGGKPGRISHGPAPGRGRQKSRFKPKRQ
jgi:hypothetical protein